MTADGTIIRVAVARWGTDLFAPIDTVAPVVPDRQAVGWVGLECGVVMPPPICGPLAR